MCPFLGDLYSIENGTTISDENVVQNSWYERPTLGACRRKGKQSNLDRERISTTIILLAVTIIVSVSWFCAFWGCI